MATTEQQAKPATQDAPTTDEGKRLDEFDGQPFYIVNGKKVDPNGQPLQDKK